MKTGDPTTIQAEARELVRLKDALEACTVIEAFPSNLGEVEGRITAKGSRVLDGAVVEIRSYLSRASEARSLALEQTARVADIVIETAIAGLIGFAHGAGLDEQQRNDGATALRAYLVETKDAAIRALGKDESS